MDTLESSRTIVRSRLADLRAAMQSLDVYAVLVPSSDPHLSEYLPERWKSREWLSGFTGSVGTLVVTRDFAGLWVDSRYWGQAEAQLAGSGIDLMKIAAASSPGHLEWLAQTVPPGARVAVDGAVLGLAGARALQSALAARNAQLVTDLDVLNQIWPDRPSLPTPPIYEHATAPTARNSKLAGIRAEMQRLGATHHFISTLDDIAWLFNLRGADVSFNPVFVAHALIDADKATLFVADNKVALELRARLANEGIAVEPYEATEKALSQLPPGARLMIDPRRITYGLRAVVPASVEVIETINPSTLAKSRKNDAEIINIRLAMEQDGAALAEFFAWLEGALGRESITELTIDEKINAARSQRPDFVSPSFATIAALNANGAMPHYRATKEAHLGISTPHGTANGLLLIDSGGQYVNGTTDITRVVPIGETTPGQRSDFTRVLKGMIALSVALFPRGTRSPMLDSLARAPIWAGGIDYGHGTGHGVGYFLNVHEGPHGITPHLAPEPQTAMEPGMVTSNEPGIYRPGRWGVRIENLLLNVPAESTEFGEFLKFETLTLCPIDTRLIDRALLRADEIQWLNAYHQTVVKRVGPLVSGAARSWLESRSAPI